MRVHCAHLGLRPRSSLAAPGPPLDEPGARGVQGTALGEVKIVPQV